MLRWFSLLVVVGTAAVAAQREGLFDYDLYQDVLDPELCRQQLKSMNTFEFYDASFRVPQGLMTGTFVSLGDYNQCLRINQQSAAGPIQGKYCMISPAFQDTLNVPLFTANSWPAHVGWSAINLTEPTKELKKYESVLTKLVHYAGTDKNMFNHDSHGQVFASVPVSLALCIPKACSVDDVLGPVSNNSLVPFTYTEQYCRLPDDKPLSGADYTAIAILSVIGLITILSTTYDVYQTLILKEDAANRNKLYSCFSVYTNSRRLFTFTTNPGSLDYLDGMRSISILWIILGHVYSNYMMLHASNLLQFFQWFSKRRAIWLISADVSVDTFFTMSGLLVVYTTVNKMNQKKLLVNIHWFYLHRLLRMFPLLALAVLLQASVFFRVTDGPNWWFLSNQVAHCRQYWWSTLLHVQNWVNSSQMCLPQTWYLSVDMQLHIASPLLLYWVLGSRRSVWSAFTAVFVAVLTACTVFCFLSDLSGPGVFMRFYYTNTLIRAPPFIIGMICGYLISIVRGKKVHMPVPLVATGYLLALVASSYAMYQAYPDWDSSIVYNLNLSFEKSLWAASVCWVAFACVCGYGGPINWFLSLQVWKFMGRISYAMFIFHFPVMFMHAGSFTIPFYYSMENIWFTFAGATAYTVVVSIAACVLVDAPCSTLQKMMMAGIRRRLDRFCVRGYTFLLAIGTLLILVPVATLTTVNDVQKLRHVPKKSPMKRNTMQSSNKEVSFKTFKSSDTEQDAKLEQES